MKKISALVTTLILGLSGAAMAAPGYGGGWHAPAEQTPIEQPSRPIDRPYHHDDQSSRGFERPFRPVMKSWVTLSSGSLLRGRDMININSSARFTTLKLEASRGSMHVNKVVIIFANGERQVAQLDQTISGRGGAATIDLTGYSRQITKVVVSGQGNFRSSFSLLAI